MNTQYNANACIKAFTVPENSEQAPDPELIPIDTAHFPDEVFRRYVSDNFDRDNNGYLNIAEIQSATKIEDLYYTFYKNERNALLQTNISNLIKLIDEHLQNSNQLSKEEVSFLYFIKCLSLDKLPEYTKESEESVNKSVRKYISYLYYS